jgi:hypothetical protein
MPGVREKGKIDQAEWDSILARHESGESLASIARSYSCTPPAIRYIVSRKRKFADANRPFDMAAESGGAAEAAAERDHGIRMEPSSARQAGNGSAATPSRRRPDAPARQHAEAAAGSSFDPTIKDRVTSDISAFLIALDSLWHVDSPENRELLLEATDRLLRAGARTRIEIERLQQLGRGRSS